MANLRSQRWASLGELLSADGPHPRYRSELALFGQFVGAWDVRVMFFDADGHPTYDARGEWRFDWILDGRAIQDVIIYPNPADGMSSAAGRRRTGSTLRFYDPEARLWNVVWVGVVTGTVAVMRARSVPPDIWLESTEPEGTLNRWVFADIEADRFHWRGLSSEDDGRSWTLNQEMFATRSLPSPDKSSL